MQGLHRAPRRAEHERAAPGELDELRDPVRGRVLEERMGRLGQVPRKIQRGARGEVERRRHDELVGLGRPAEASLREVEFPCRRERGARAGDRRDAVEEPLAQGGADVHRAGSYRHAPLPHVNPADDRLRVPAVDRFVPEDVAEVVAQVARPPCDHLEGLFLAGARDGLERLEARVERGVGRPARRGQVVRRESSTRLPGAPRPRQLGEENAPSLPHALEGPAHRTALERLERVCRSQRGLRVARERFDACGGGARPEEIGRDVLDLVGLVEDQGVVGR